MSNRVEMQRLTLTDYLSLRYPFRVIADNEIGGYVIAYPDLPGCTTHVDRIDEVGEAAEEIRRLWIRTQYEDGDEIPAPTYPEEYSGKFNLRLPKSLHRELAEAADSDGISLNQYVVALLSGRNESRRVDRTLTGLQDMIGELQAQIDEVREGLQYEVRGGPKPSGRTKPFYLVSDKAVAA